MANELTIWCVVDGESTAFSVKPKSAESVDDLKKAIKKQRPNDLAKVAADRLALWKVSIPIEDDERPISLDNLTDKKKLKVSDKISVHFPETPANGIVHIIVQLPSPGKTTQCSVQAFQRTLAGVVKSICEPIIARRPMSTQERFIRVKKLLLGHEHLAAYSDTLFKFNQCIHRE
ncbi:hypothetical protein BGZ65_006582 [Modicella reniformis]|uniref:Crinkler effector protein N-terminal domain-containing protein n=1 Tax=Modicella reniformis TaxID=1440133 RepID=A0A9P6SP66_9FUNG|nr:hypothetical protein BGZ65_006582 [Modicella reniformis]